MSMYSRKKNRKTGGLSSPHVSLLMREPGTRLACSYEGSECCVHVPCVQELLKDHHNFFLCSIVYMEKY